VVGGVAGAIVGSKHHRVVHHSKAWYRAHAKANK
jgi:hypothetical protein